MPITVSGGGVAEFVSDNCCYLGRGVAEFIIIKNYC